MDFFIITGIAGKGYISSNPDRAVIRSFNGQVWAAGVNTIDTPQVLETSRPGSMPSDQDVKLANSFLHLLIDQHLYRLALYAYISAPLSPT